MLVGAGSGLWTPPAAASAQCGPRLTPYEGYRLRTVTLNSPFSFLRTLDGTLDPLRAHLPPAGSPLAATTVAEAVQALRDALGSTGSTGGIGAVAAFTDNCDDDRRELDLIFYVFTSGLSAPGAFSLEFAERLRQDPATAAGVAPPRSRLTVEPNASFNDSDKLTGGLQVAFVHSSGFRLVGEGAASSRYTNVALSATGSHDFEWPALWRATYGAGYRFQEQPVENRNDLEQRYAFGWLSAATRPVRGLDVPIRYAVQLETGSQHSRLSSPGFESDTAYTAAKLLAGVTGGVGPHDFSLSVGYQIGTDGSLAAAWHKILLDGAYGVRVAPATPFFDHRSLDLDARFAGGWLEPAEAGRAPQNERFFGGLRPRRFTEIPDWNVRSTPFIRGYPNNRFRATLGGDASGREHFASVNLTASLTAWRRPLLPREVYTNEGFLQAMEAQKGGARATIRSYHESRDPAIAEVARLAERVEPILTTLQTEVEAVSDDLADARDTCLDTIDDTRGTLDKARERKIYRALLNRVQGGLPIVVRDCQEELNATLDNPRIREAADQLAELSGAIDTIFTTRVDTATVDRKADEDFSIVNRALTALVRDINLISLDPVAIFDTAYVGPSATTMLRYSVGGGLRLTLGSIAAFTLGYAANPNRGSGDPRGAVFFELKVFDLLR